MASPVYLAVLYALRSLKKEIAVTSSAALYDLQTTSALDAARGHLRHQSQDAVLEVVFLEAVATAQAALLDVDRLGVRIILGPLPSDETCWAGVAVNLQRPRGGATGRTEGRSVNLVLYVLARLTSISPNDSRIGSYRLFT